MILFNSKSSYNCFSNDSPHHVHMHGEEFKTVTHYYHSMKFRKTHIERLVRNAETPAEARLIAKQNKEYMLKSWDRMRLLVMRQAVLSKFKIHRAIRKILIKTGEEEIVYNSKNSFWGRGRDGKGQNYLGKILMDVRKEVAKITIIM